MSGYSRMEVKNNSQNVSNLVNMNPTNPEILINTKQDKDQPLTKYLIVKLLKNTKKGKETSWETRYIIIRKQVIQDEIRKQVNHL